MGKLGADIQGAIAEMGGNTDQARINLRAHQVRNRYRQALESVYGESAELFLAHTNNVYIMNKNDVRILIVYVDESIYAAELNAQRELIKLKLLQLFGEEIETFEIFISRGNYKNNHPFIAEEPLRSNSDCPSIPLDDEEAAYVLDASSQISDARLRNIFQKAMTADLEWKKGEKAENSADNLK